MELQILHADAENRKKSGDNLYKMNQESIITIQEELLENMYAMAQVQIYGIRKLLEEFEDDQLQVTLELEAYEQERRLQAIEKRAK